MKRFWLIFIILLMSVSLFGCTKQQITSTANINGVDFLVDWKQQTISNGEDVYRFDLSGDSTSYNVTITYPDGSTYWYHQSDGSGYGDLSDDYSEENYVSGDSLVYILEAGLPKRANPGNILGGLFVIALGLFNILAPYAAWYLSYGWHFKDAEPSDAALTFTRIGGGVAIIVGIVLLLS